MQDLTTSNDLLTVNIGISASPIVDIDKQPARIPSVATQPLAANAGEISALLEIALQYDSLTRIINRLLAGKRIDLSEGLFAQHIVIRQVIVGGSKEGNLLLRVDFSGSLSGIVHFKGRPSYNEATQTLEIQNLHYDLQTKNLLLKGAKWLFASKIESELKRASRLSLTQYFQSAQAALTGFLNKEWTTGVNGTGEIKDITLISVQVLPEHLLALTRCEGTLRITVSDSLVNFQR